MSARLFGTDGVRGRAGAPPLDTRTVRRLGMALVKALPRSPGAIRLLVGRDTRESGEHIERDLALGATAAGATVVSAGVIPTPAVAHLTRSQGFAAGLVISASHNPFHDNGIKVFSGGGEKFTESLEAGVEAVIADVSWQEPGGDCSRRAADRRGRRLPRSREACPRRAVSGPRPADRHRLRERRDLPGGAGAAAEPRLRGHRDWLRARRAQHQPRVRIHSSRAAGADGGPRGLRPGRGVRRRRRSGHPRRRRRAHRRRRCRPADVRQADAGGGAAARERRRRHRDEQPRPRDRASRSRHRAGALPGRRQVRHGRAAARQPVARR